MSKIKLLLWLVGGLVCNLITYSLGLFVYKYAGQQSTFSHGLFHAFVFENKPSNNLLFFSAFFLTKDYNLCHLVVLLYGPMRRELGLCYTVRLPKAAQCSFINSPLHRCSRKSFVNTINRKFCVIWKLSKKLNSSFLTST